MKKAALVILVVILLALVTVVPAFADQPPWAPPQEPPPSHGGQGDSRSHAKCDNSQVATQATGHAPWWKAWGLENHAGPGRGCPG